MNRRLFLYPCLWLFLVVTGSNLLWAQAPPQRPDNDNTTVSPPPMLGKIRDIAISRDGKFAIAGDSERTIWVWDVAKRKLIRAIQDRSTNQNTIPHYAFSADGKFAVVGNERGNQIGGIPNTILDSKTLTLWDLTAGVKLRDLDMKDEPVLAVALSPDGKRALSVSVWKTVPRRRYPYDPDFRQWENAIDLYALKLWDTSTGKLLQTLSEFADRGPLAFSADGTFFTTALAGPRPPFDEKQTWYLKKWNTSSGDDLGAKSMAAEWSSMMISCFAFSPDGKYIVTAGSQSIGVWNLGTGKLLWQRSCLDECKTMRDGIVAAYWSIRSIAFSPDSKRVVAAGWDGPKIGGMMMMDAVTGKNQPGFAGIKDESVWSISFSPDGSMLLGASGEGMRFWNARTGATLFTLKN